MQIQTCSIKDTGRTLCDARAPGINFGSGEGVGERDRPSSEVDLPTPARSRGVPGVARAARAERAASCPRGRNRVSDAARGLCSQVTKLGRKHLQTRLELMNRGMPPFPGGPHAPWPSSWVIYYLRHRAPQYVGPLALPPDPLAGVLPPVDDMLASMNSGEPPFPGGPPAPWFYDWAASFLGADILGYRGPPFAAPPPPPSAGRRMGVSYLV